MKQNSSGYLCVVDNKQHILYVYSRSNAIEKQFNSEFCFIHNFNLLIEEKGFDSFGVTIAGKIISDFLRVPKKEIKETALIKMMGFMGSNLIDKIFKENAYMREFFDIEQRKQFKWFGKTIQYVILKQRDESGLYLFPLKSFQGRVMIKTIMNILY